MNTCLRAASYPDRHRRIHNGTRSMRVKANATPPAQSVRCPYVGRNKHCQAVASHKEKAMFAVPIWEMNIWMCVCINQPDIRVIPSEVDAITVGAFQTCARQTGSKSPALSSTTARSTKHGTKSIGLLWYEMSTPINENDEPGS
jgi:hypothetical protein